ncbi:MAG: dTDP-4-dehydrorhamnose 3,5-epimerase [Betaproteobacteria bacterium]|jgi:dTDP-4-dehydrorhamnose 3,5-epimerase|nr:dTDP-4-dehydrorhamnose 3,5-epimerase [Betaproteobacteria bacterium]NBT98580.1 dTDP-4-dehydrorhamnose 3,5-epimerase [Betaproteobacteria bacterium]NCW84709.1 dTDP-4-dehydrorhamnose 3,5-epimerase [Oxalobacteraceae bacterium]NCX02403.1 dTDP-4-dehydrorhamnose 3,5-epimerase [Betaproteobacteria bacterium]NDG05905.1 dTDP-4-dehydrorhamnose 3,5-epimerase [Oxalobacteraceae bacterium]
MKAIPTQLAGPLILEPQVFGDDRGFFLESWNEKTFKSVTGLPMRFVQDNHSRSACGVLRGLHFQRRIPQGKLVRVTSGSVWDVAVDIRVDSPSFGQYVACELSAANHRQLWIPPGFAHGFLVLSESADFLYKTTAYWMPEHERSLLWNDPAIGIQWPLDRLEGKQPRLAAKDASAQTLAELKQSGDLLCLNDSA